MDDYLLILQTVPINSQFEYLLKLTINLEFPCALQLINNSSDWLVMQQFPELFRVILKHK